MTHPFFKFFKLNQLFAFKLARAGSFAEPSSNQQSINGFGFVEVALRTDF